MSKYVEDLGIRFYLLLLIEGFLYVSGTEHRRSVQKKSSHCYCNKNDLHNIHVTWQPRRVDWNAHV